MAIKFFEEGGSHMTKCKVSHSIYNQIKRGDLEGVKIGAGTHKRLANVPFKITSKTTGESHIVVTDKNGQFSTASRKPQQKGDRTMAAITYSRQGDYLLPNLIIPEEEEVHLGKYAYLRNQYLMKNRYGMYLNLLTAGTLNQHLLQTEEEAQMRMETEWKHLSSRWQRKRE